MPVALLEAALAVVLGGCLYLFTRPEGLWMFAWVRTLGAEGALQRGRGELAPLAAALPGWVRFSLPDALWAFAFASALCWVWQQRLTKSSAVWLALGPTIALGLELGQGLGLVRGTFDWRDFGLLAIASVLGLRRVRLVSPTRQAAT